MQVHPLLVHALGLHPLDEAEEVLVGHRGRVGARLRGGAPLVVDPGRLGGGGRGGGRRLEGLEQGLPELLLYMYMGCVIYMYKGDYFQPSPPFNSMKHIGMGTKKNIIYINN